MQKDFQKKEHLRNNEGLGNVRQWVPKFEIQLSLDMIAHVHRTHANIGLPDL